MRGRCGGSGVEDIDPLIREETMTGACAEMVWALIFVLTGRVLSGIILLSGTCPWTDSVGGSKQMSRFVVIDTETTWTDEVIRIVTRMPEHFGYLSAEGSPGTK